MRRIILIAMNIPRLLIFLIVLSSCIPGNNERTPNEGDAPESCNYLFDYQGDDPIMEAIADAMGDEPAVPLVAEINANHKEVTLWIDKDSCGFLTPECIINSRKHNLASLSGTEGTTMATLVVSDLDGDGCKEILYHSGDIMTLNIFSVGEEPGCLSYAGSIPCNSGFFQTDDGRIVSLFGSQGSACIARYADGHLEFTEEDGIDRLLFASKEYHNLRYSFDDTSADDRKHKPLFKTTDYIICHKSDIAGCHALKMDLDNDGVMEDLYFGNLGWGATTIDNIRVNAVTESYSIMDVMIGNRDSIALDITEFDRTVKDYLQLSAFDVDCDGTPEIIASAGTRRKSSNYIFTYDNGLSLKDHFFWKGLLHEKDLRNRKQ